MPATTDAAPPPTASPDTSRATSVSLSINRMFPSASRTCTPTVLIAFPFATMGAGLNTMRKRCGSPAPAEMAVEEACGKSPSTPPGWSSANNRNTSRSTVAVYIAVVNRTMPETARTTPNSSRPGASVLNVISSEKSTSSRPRSSRASSTGCVRNTTPLIAPSG